jgi:hypothetical protein
MLRPPDGQRKDGGGYKGDAEQLVFKLGRKFGQRFSQNIPPLGEVSPQCGKLLNTRANKASLHCGNIFAARSRQFS